MKKLILMFSLCALIGACAPKPQAANSGEAISKADTMTTVEEKTKYLVSEANAFVNSQKFDDAIKTAQYILSKLDSESVEAKSILEKAKAELEKMAQAKMEEIKGDLKGKIDAFGK